jgi:hypothetical protein
MKVTCQLCGDVIRVDFVRLPIPASLEGVARNDAELTQQLQEYDLLAGTMSRHLNNKHPNQSEEQAGCMFLAGKMYAMNWADAPELEALKREWRNHVLMRMTVTTQRDGDASPVPASDSTVGSEDAVPTASNEKKSIRKDSIC